MKNISHEVRLERRRSILLLRCVAWAYAPVSIAFAVAAVLDDSMVSGERAWLKPLKFAVSIGLNGAAAVWLMRRLPASRTVTAAAISIAVGLIGEQALITLQAGRGVTSHFNTDTGFDSAVFSAMGVLVAVVWAATLVVAVSATRTSARLPAGVRAVVPLGTWLVLLGGSIGFVMIAAGKHSIGSSDGTGGRLPLVGWSSTNGDLRPAHFIGLHGLQLLIVVAALCEGRARRTAAVRGAARAIAVACVGFAGQALGGLPITSASSVVVVGVALAVGGAALLTSSDDTGDLVDAEPVLAHS